MTGNPDWQRDLPIAHLRLAKVFHAMGDKAQALDELRQGRTVVARLAETFGDRANWKRMRDAFDEQIAELTR